jgi:hypothetical protein
MVQSSGVYTIPYGTAAALPFAPTLAGTFVGGQDHLRRLDATEPLRPLEWEWRGPTELSLAVLDQMVRNFKDPQNSRHQDPEILVRGVRSRVFRVSVFCAGGYLTTFIADSARPDATDGRIEVSALFPAPVAADGHIAARPLRVSTALDLINRFPILIEADQRPDFSGEKADFRATHANRTPAWLHLDRRFAAWWPLN